MVCVAVGHMVVCVFTVRPGRGLGVLVRHGGHVCPPRPKVGQVRTVAPGGGAAGGGGVRRGDGCMLACWEWVIKCGCAVHGAVNLLRRVR